MLFNSDPAFVNLNAIEGNTIDMVFYINSELIDFGRKFYANCNSAPVHGSPYLMADLKIQVRRKDRLLIKEWLSGVSPSDIVITDGHFRLTDETGFEESGVFDYDLIDTSENISIMRGEWLVKKQITL